jgi:hypothetical protein
MDLTCGIRLESPALVVPWGITAAGLHALLPHAKELNDDALAAEVVWIGGLSQTMRFFFRPEGGGGTLSTVEAGGPAAGRLEDLDGPFQDLRARLVSALGPPTGTSPGPFSDRYPESRWEVPGAAVRHWVIDGHRTDHALLIRPR